jgi:sulfur-oxidizing protein SoxZ
MTSRIGPARIRMPEQAKAGEVFEVRTMVEHPNESGFRHDNQGRPIPRHIVVSFECVYNGKTVFGATLHPAVSTNPYMTFFVKAVDSGDFVFTWKDDQGGVTTTTQSLRVV